MKTQGSSDVYKSGIDKEVCWWAQLDVNSNYTMQNQRARKNTPEDFHERD